MNVSATQEEWARVITYSEFINRVVGMALCDLPEDTCWDREFCGDIHDQGIPSPDFGAVRYDRAIYLGELIRDTGFVMRDVRHPMGLSLERDYGTTVGDLRNYPVLYHGAYAHSIRRWLRGDLPRKWKARAEVVLVATCWLLDWDSWDEHADDARNKAARMFDDCGFDLAFLSAEDECQFVEVFWRVSSMAYRTSLNSRSHA